MSEAVNPALSYARFAENDYITARTLLIRREAWTENSICLHCQQSVEKFLKAFILESGEDHPRTHDLVTLIKICRKYDQDFSNIEDDCEALNDFSVKSRYPDDYVLYDFEEAQTALNRAEFIRDFVLSRLNCRNELLEMRRS